MEAVCGDSANGPSEVKCVPPTVLPSEIEGASKNKSSDETQPLSTPPMSPLTTTCTNADTLNLYEYPDVSLSALSRNFVVDLPNIEITSLDVTANGCFILAGCSNGMVVLFDMTSKDKNGTLAGQIRAKGMHTNLIATVKFSQDCRYGFAGVIKGSMEMLAVDVGQVQVWHDAALQSSDSFASARHKRNSIADMNGLRHKTNAAKLVRTYSHLDPKLRGFGAVSCLTPESDGKYVLVCGKGIKNVHIWTFTAPKMSTAHPFEASSDPVWTCLYDVATNGVTIESLGFREKLYQDEHGEVTSRLEMMSKSSGMGIRTWTLGDLQRQDGPLHKIPYEDTPNSADCKAFCEGGTLSFGGTYEFSVIRLDAPKWANRESYEVPLRCNEDDNGERRRRLMRQIDQVLATQDGCHALALCTDGGVLYYHANPTSTDDAASMAGDSSGGGHSNAEAGDDATDWAASGGSEDLQASGGSQKVKKRCGQLVEFQHLSREVEIGPQFMTDNAWCLKRVGRRGVVVLIRACQGVRGKEGCDSAGALIDVSLLSDLAPDEVGDTSLQDDAEWRRWRYYHDKSATVGWDVPKPVVEPDLASEGSGDSTRGRVKTLSRGRPPTGQKVGVKPAKPASASTPRQERPRADSADGTAGPSSKRPQSAYATPTGGASRDAAAAGLHDSSKARVEHISPYDNPLPPRGPRSTSQGKSMPSALSPAHSEASLEGLSAVSKRLYSYGSRESSRKKSKYDTGMSDSEESEEGSSAQPLSLPAPAPPTPKVIPRPGPAPVVKRVQSSRAVLPRQLRHPVLDAVTKIISQWKADSYISASTPQEFNPKGPHTRACQTALLYEQRMLYEQYLSETGRCVEAAVSAFVDNADDYGLDIGANVVSLCRRAVLDLNKHYRDVVKEVVHRQNMELRCERAKDIMLSLGTAMAISLSAEQSTQWRFFYSDMYEAGNACARELEKLPFSQLLA